MSMFDSIFYTLSDKSNLFVVNVKEDKVELKRHLDLYLTLAYANRDKSDLKIVKKELFLFLTNKTEITRIGAIAELLVHLFLREQGYDQACLMENLEESSIKKGFDGLYENDTFFWVVESKSGQLNGTLMKHKDKISIAYNDLKSKIEGTQKKVANGYNPWKNAYSHAKAADRKNDLLDKLRLLSNDYTLKKYKQIKDFKIIPSSTLFYSKYGNQMASDVKQDMIKLDLLKDYSQCVYLTFNIKNIDIIIEYLEDNDE